MLWYLQESWVNVARMSEPGTTADLPPTHSEWLALVTALRGEIAQQANTIRTLSQTVEKLTFDLLMFKRRMFGRSAEASDLLQVQGQLFPITTAQIDLPATLAAPLTRIPSVPKVPFARKGRMILPEHLPRHEQTLLPPGVTDADNRLLPQFVQIREERTERLASTPAGLETARRLHAVRVCSSL